MNWLDRKVCVCVGGGIYVIYPKFNYDLNLVLFGHFYLAYFSYFHALRCECYRCAHTCIHSHTVCKSMQKYAIDTGGLRDSVKINFMVAMNHSNAIGGTGHICKIPSFCKNLGGGDIFAKFWVFAKFGGRDISANIRYLSGIFVLT